MRKHKLPLVLVTSSLIASLGCASKKTEEIPAAVQPAVASVPGPATAPSPGIPAITPTGFSAVTCVKGKDSRTLDIRTKGEGCEAVYTKGGQGAVVGTAKKGTTRCEATIKKIKQKLVAGGYSCQ